jgi:hypothetical protein
MGWASQDLAGCTASKHEVISQSKYLPNVVLGMDFTLDRTTKKLKLVELPGWQVKEYRD